MKKSNIAVANPAEERPQLDLKLTWLLNLGASAPRNPVILATEADLITFVDTNHVLKHAHHAAFFLARQRHVAITTPIGDQSILI